MYINIARKTAKNLHFVHYFLTAWNTRLFMQYKQLYHRKFVGIQHIAEKGLCHRLFIDFWRKSAIIYLGRNADIIIVEREKK